MYSQNNEEKLILEYFNGEKGAFWDIGANDGKTLSNTWAIRQIGWGGVLIEASPRAYERLIDNYKNLTGCFLYNFAIGSYDGEIVLHESGELLGVGDTSLVSSTREDETKRWKSLNMPFADVKVSCAKVDTFLSKCPIDKFDLLSIDIEGMEPEVVPQIDFTKLGIRMAIVEWNGKDADLYDGILFSHGLKLIHINAENRIYTK